MKTEAIEKNIISNYSRLSKLAKVKNDGNIHHFWGLKYKNGKTKGYISQLGNAEVGKSKIQIIDNNIDLIKKPFFLTWSQALKRIDNLIINTINNLNNPEVVEKRIVSFLAFPKEAVKKIWEHSKKA